MLRQELFIIACMFSTLAFAGCFEENNPTPEKDVPPPCQSGTIKCENSISRTCVEGQWRNAQKCLNGCDAEGKCILLDAPVQTGICTSGIRQCQQGNSYLCINGDWVQNEICTTTCNPTTGKCEQVPASCTNGAYKCQTDTSYKCVEGDWVQNEICTNGCDLSSGNCEQVPASCTNGAYKCQTDISYKCVEGIGFRMKFVPMAAI